MNTSRQKPDSPLPQQGASEPINGLTGLCVYLSYTHDLFPTQINFICPKKTTTMPPWYGLATRVRLVFQKHSINCQPSSQGLLEFLYDWPRGN